MPVTTNLSNDGKNAAINIIGRFDFSLQKEFRDAYKDVAPGVKFCVDLSQTEYMDSAALGMLLLLKQHAGDHSGNVVLSRPSEDVRKILAVANFDKIFTVE